jgi:hypothetical protein
VLKSGEGFGDVPWHGKVDGPGIVVPSECSAAIDSACPVGGDRVLGGEGVERVLGVEQVLGVGAISVLYSEVIDDEGKVVGREMCLKRPAVWWVGMYPYGARCLTSRSLARRPAWGRPYMPSRIATRT